MAVDGNNLREVDLNTLFKFIKPIDDTCEKLTPFLNNTDSAFQLASVNQKKKSF